VDGSTVPTAARRSTTSSLATGGNSPTALAEPRDRPDASVGDAEHVRGGSLANRRASRAPDVDAAVRPGASSSSLRTPRAAVGTPSRAAIARAAIPKTLVA